MRLDRYKAVKILKLFIYCNNNTASIFLFYLDLFNFTDNSPKRKIKVKRRSAILMSAYL